VPFRKAARLSVCGGGLVAHRDGARNTIRGRTTLWVALSLGGALAAQTASPQDAENSPKLKQAGVNGVTLTYQEQGQGIPVVFVHGTVSDLRAWDKQREAVAAHHHFIALTQRYYGTNPWPDDGSKFSMATHIEDLTSFLRELNVGPVELVGWSYGGPIALLTAIQQPELVHGLFLYEPATASAITNPDDLKTATDDGKAVGIKVSETLKADGPVKAVQVMIGEITHSPDAFDTLPASFQAMFRDNARTLLIAARSPPPLTCDQLGQLTKAVTIARGEMTRPFFRITADAVAHCIPGAKLIIIPEGRHDAVIQRAPDFNKALLEFLGQESAAATTGQAK
jgi:pimeloyl-ACP methyl ester carboxylesterase